MQQDSSDETGVANPSGHGSKELTRARTRKAGAALALVLDGETNWKIVAKSCGYPTPRAAMVAVERMLEKRLDTLDKDHLRLMVSARLDRLLKPVMAKATNEESPEHLAAVQRARELIADYRRLWGLDAPQEVLVTSPTQRDLDAFVYGVLEGTLPSVGNADIVDAELVGENETFEAEAG